MQASLTDTGFDMLLLVIVILIGFIGAGTIHHFVRRAQRGRYERRRDERRREEEGSGLLPFTRQDLQSATTFFPRAERFGFRHPNTIGMKTAESQNELYYSYPSSRNTSASATPLPTPHPSHQNMRRIGAGAGGVRIPASKRFISPRGKGKGIATGEGSDADCSASPSSSSSSSTRSGSGAATPESTSSSQAQAQAQAAVLSNSTPPTGFTGVPEPPVAARLAPSLRVG